MSAYKITQYFENLIRKTSYIKKYFTNFHLLTGKKSKSFYDKKLLSYNKQVTLKLDFFFGLLLLNLNFALNVKCKCYRGGWCFSRACASLPRRPASCSWWLRLRTWCSLPQWSSRTILRRTSWNIFGTLDSRQKH